MKVGKYTYGHNSVKVAHWGEPAELIIGKFCSIAACTVILGGNHRTNYVTTYPFGFVNTHKFPYEKQKDYRQTNGDVIIGNDVWIGMGATIMSGVKIGDGAIIAANAHVVKNVKPYSVVGGNPAEFYYYRFKQETIKKLLELKWWDWSDEKIKENIPLLLSENFDELLK